MPAKTKTKRITPPFDGNVYPSAETSSNPAEEFAQFAYTVSHNLKEPLREVSIFAERLQREQRDNLDEKGKEGLRHILAGTQRINEILDDLFLYSQAGSWKLNPVSVDLNVLLNEVMFNLGPAIQESGATFIRGEMPTIIADRMQVMMLFEHLIGNAIKFRSQEPPRIHIGADTEHLPAPSITIRFRTTGSASTAHITK